MRTIRLQVQVPRGGRIRCSGDPLDLPQGVCLPAPSPHRAIPPKGDTLYGHHHCRDTLLAEETLVPSTVTPEPSTPHHAASQGRPSRTKPHSASGSKKFTSDGLDIEREKLHGLGCLSSVVDTLLQARKPSTNITYRRVWDQFLAAAATHNFSPTEPSVNNVLDFLQAGLDLGLSWNTLRVHVSAISSLTSTRWSFHPLIAQFLKACLKLRPPRKQFFPPWDLTVVLTALSTMPYFPLENVTLLDLTLKTIFLVAITSAKRVSELHALAVGSPYCEFFADRVVLRPNASFLPKVSTAFHFDQEITLPSLLEASGKPHPLDVTETLKAYIAATQDIRLSSALFVLPRGPKKGQPASIRIIASWLVRIIKKTYSIQGIPIPQEVRAHSTRAVATSWAAFSKVSVETICKAATWSSRTTFLNHYRVDPSALTTASFGKNIIIAGSSV